MKSCSRKKYDMCVWFAFSATRALASCKCNRREVNKCEGPTGHVWLQRMRAAAVMPSNCSGICVDRKAEWTKLLFVRICREYLVSWIWLQDGKATKYICMYVCNVMYVCMYIYIYIICIELDMMCKFVATHTAATQTIELELWSFRQKCEVRSHHHGLWCWSCWGVPHKNGWQGGQDVWAQPLRYLSSWTIAFRRSLVFGWHWGVGGGACINVHVNLQMKYMLRFGCRQVHVFMGGVGWGVY